MRRFSQMLASCYCNPCAFHVAEFFRGFFSWAVYIHFIYTLRRMLLVRSAPRVFLADCSAAWDALDTAYFEFFSRRLYAASNLLDLGRTALLCWSWAGLEDKSWHC